MDTDQDTEMTRAQAQQQANQRYASKAIDLAEWRRLTAELSDVRQWITEGRIPDSPNKVLTNGGGATTIPR